MVRVAIASDHAGYKLKKYILNVLDNHVELIDLGTYSEDPVDYPDIAKRLVKALRSGEAEYGILICGTGIGMSIAANKYRGIRAALIYSEESAELARKHNDANVVCLGGRTMKHNEAIKWVLKWLRAGFEGGRHERRINKIREAESPCP